VYPISLTKSNGQVVTVNNNTQLESTINGVIDDCSSSGSGSLDIADVITNGTWHISYCYYGFDQTSYYNGYNFTFHDNGTSVAIKNTNSIDGDWDVHYDTSPQRLDLNFDGSTLHDLAANWNIQELTTTYLRLKRESGGGGDYYLDFIKN
jgi:hypothetical protein